MRRFTRTPHYTGPDDPARDEVRGPLQLGETVVIETVGGHDQDYTQQDSLLAGAVFEVREPRQARRGGPFFVEGIEAGDWLALEIIDIEVGPYGFYRNGGPLWGSMRCVAPVRDGLVHFPPDFVVPVRPMIGFVRLESVASYEIDTGGNMDYNSVQPGSTLHIRAQKRGGMFTLTDVHARMGDGELNGGGVDIEAEVTVETSLRKGLAWHRPVIEMPDSWCTCANAPGLEAAIRQATSDMTTLIATALDMSREEAFILIGAAGDARIGQAASLDMDCTAYLRMTKEILPTVFR